MKIVLNIKFRAASILLLFIFTIITLSASKASVKDSNACARIEKQDFLKTNNVVNKKCNACHTNVISNY